MLIDLGAAEPGLVAGGLQAGDALVTSAQLSPIATYEGRIVGENIVNGASKTPDYKNIPSAVYTVPALSSVGMTESEADQSGLKYDVNKSAN